MEELVVYEPAQQPLDVIITTYFYLQIMSMLHLRVTLHCFTLIKGYFAFIRTTLSLSYRLTTKQESLQDCHMLKWI